MKNITRRSFIKSSAISSGILLAPNLLSANNINKLNIAVIGVGGRGRANWSQVLMKILLQCVMLILIEHLEVSIYTQMLKDIKITGLCLMKWLIKLML